MISVIESRLQLAAWLLLQTVLTVLAPAELLAVKSFIAVLLLIFPRFSFHAVKNFTTAEGGAAAWRAITGVDNAEIYKFYQLLLLHGQDKDALAKTQVGAWEYDIIGAWYAKQFIVGCFGGHALSNALDNCLSVAKSYQKLDKNTVFVFVGDGVEKTDTARRKRKHQKCVFSAAG